MPTHCFTEENAQALRDAEGLFRLHVPPGYSRATANSLELVLRDGSTRPAPGDQSATPFDPETYRGRKVSVTQVTRKPPGDFMFLDGRSIPKVVTKRVLEALHDGGFGSCFAVEAELAFEGGKKPRKTFPEYAALFPAPAGERATDLHSPGDPFATSRIVPPPHRPGETDVFALPTQRGGISSMVFVHAPIVELALRQEWDNVHFVHAHLPDALSVFENRAHIREDGSISWRPPMPPELSPQEWLDFAHAHPRDPGRPGTLRQSVELALVHHAESMLPLAAAQLKEERTPARRLTAASIVRTAARLYQRQQMPAPPMDRDLTLANETMSALFT
jgi:hypothetical protein